MPYRNLNDVPTALREAGLTLAQTNEWRPVFETVRALGNDEADALARAWIDFKTRFDKVGGKWVKRARNVKEMFGLEILSGDWVQNPWRLTESNHARRGSPANTTYHVTNAVGDHAEVWAVFRRHILERSDGTWWLHGYTGSGSDFELGEAVEIDHEDAVSIVIHLAEAEKYRTSELLEAGRRNNASDKRRISQIIELGLDLLNSADADDVLTKIMDARSPAKKTEQLDPDVRFTISITEQRTGQPPVSGSGSTGRPHVRASSYSPPRGADDVRRGIEYGSIEEVAGLTRGQVSGVLRPLLRVASDLDSCARLRTTDGADLARCASMLERAAHHTRVEYLTERDADGVHVGIRMAMPEIRMPTSTGSLLSVEDAEEYGRATRVLRESVEHVIKRATGAECARKSQSQPGKGMGATGEMVGTISRPL